MHLQLHISFKRHDRGIQLHGPINLNLFLKIFLTQKGAIVSNMRTNNCVILYDITLGFNIAVRPNLKYCYIFHIVGWQTEHREKMQRGNIKRGNLHPKAKEGPKGNDCLYFQGLVVVVVVVVVQF